MVRLFSEISFGVGYPEVIRLPSIFLFFFFRDLYDRKCRRGRRDLKRWGMRS
jgi:hypothetical protein